MNKFKVVGASVLAASFLISNVAFAVAVPGQVKTRLQDLKLRSCQARESVIKNRSQSLSRIVDEMIKHFDRIATKVKTYYTEKVVPSGKSVANYDALVADIDAKKAAAETALQKAKDDFKTFSCTSDDPKGQMVIFREDMQAVKTALRDYRKSVKDLIVAVRSVASEEATTQQDSTSEQNTEQNNEGETNQ